MYRPLVCLVLGWLAGEWVANNVGHGPYWLLCLLAWTLGCLFYCRYMKGLLFILFLIGVTTGAAYFVFVDESNTSHFSVPVTGKGIGRVVSQPLIDGDYMRFDLKLGKLNADHREITVPAETVRIGVRLGSPLEKQWAKNLNQNCLIELPLSLERPASARNPGAFDYQRYLRHYQIFWQAEVPTLKQIHTLSCHPTLQTRIEQLRQVLSDRLDQLYPPNQAGLLQAMILGKQQTLDPTTQEVFSTLGLVHIISISGLHVSILIGSLYFLLLACGLTRERVAVAIICFLPFYVLLTGSSAPVIRSAIVAGMMLLAVVLRRTSDAVSFLALALLIQLIWNPYQLWEPGFQLSFLITAGLLTVVEPLAHHIPLPGHRLRQAIAVMIVSQVLSFPIIITYFYQYAWPSGIVNLLFVPIYSVIILPLSTISLLISFLSFGWGGLLAKVVTWIMTCLDEVLRWCSQLPHMTSSIPPPSFWWVVCYALLVWWTYVAIISDQIVFQRSKYGTIPILLFLLVFAVFGAGWFRHTTMVTIVDVGQGDSTLIETPEGHVILIDGGGTLPQRQEAWQKKIKPYEVGRDVLVPYLRYRGINHIDTVMMTHGDGDHIRGLEAVIRRFSIGRVLHNGEPPADPYERHLLTLIYQKHIPIEVAARGDSWQIEPGIIATILHPTRTAHPANINNGSLVMILSVYRTKLLFTGDMEEPSEQEVLAHYHLQAVDILKVGHHGSNTSTHEAWLSAVKPRHALISVGIHNRYGHPKPEVLARLRKFGAHIWRTDQQGAIMLKINPTGYSIDSMKGEENYDR